MVRTFAAVALAASFAAALPAPTPIVTPLALLPRQVVAEGCTLADFPATTFGQDIVTADENGAVFTSTSSYTLSATQGCKSTLPLPSLPALSDARTR